MVISVRQAWPVVAQKVPAEQSALLKQQLAPSILVQLWLEGVRQVPQLRFVQALPTEVQDCDPLQSLFDKQQLALSILVQTWLESVWQVPQMGSGEIVTGAAKLALLEADPVSVQEIESLVLLV